MNRPLAGLFLATALVSAGCRAPQPGGAPPPASPIQPTHLTYSDSDSFDVVLEASLVNEDPVIIIRTEHTRPDWTGRLNAWIAAWNMGGKGERRVARGQIPFTTATLDADLLREFRLLIFGAVDRAEELARTSSMWWREEQTRSRRVALLRPYSLRFHVAEDGKILVVFFNGKYAAQYAEFVKTMTPAEEGEWQRCVECSVAVRPPPSTSP